MNPDSNAEMGKEKNLYLSLKKADLFYFVLGAYISSDNEYTQEKCDMFISQLENLLNEIPEEEEGDRQRVKECLEFVWKEKNREDL